MKQLFNNFKRYNGKNYIVVEKEEQIQEFIDGLIIKSDIPFGKWRVKRALKKLPYERTNYLYELRFILKNSHKGKTADGIDCVNRESIFLNCGIHLDIHTYIYRYEAKMKQNET